MTLLPYAVVYTTLATAGLVLLRRSLEGAALAALPTDPEFVCGGLLYAASFATFLVALRRFEVLTVYPIFTGLAYATVTAAAALFLGESLGATRVAGIAFIGVGVALLFR